MKNLFYSFVIVSSLFLIQCSNEIPITSDPINLELGKISLKIDKDNAPDNVALVEAFLTRTEHDTIYGALNILTSTSADILFEGVAAGEWHLIVNAKDSAAVIVYTGETEVDVSAGLLTTVELVLIPTGLGVGSIYIYVRWGNSNTDWIDFENNPVLTSSNTYWDYVGVQQPKILFEDGLYKMWYLGLADGSASNVGYAISSDGINWTKPFSDPVLSPGVSGSWDETSTIAGAVIKEESGYKMYYVGWSNPYEQWHIGLATSSDGITWQKHPLPVLYGTTGWETRIVPSSILKISGIYYLYYYGSMVNNNKIGLATSTDGINWTKYSGNPILEATQSWEGSGIAHPSVIKDEGIYKMVYVNKASNGFGIATSIDGITWTKDNHNPFFIEENTTNNWADEDIAYPFFMKINNEYRIYYSGIGDPNSIVYRIGFMRKFDN